MDSQHKPDESKDQQSTSRLRGFGQRYQQKQAENVRARESSKTPEQKIHESFGTQGGRNGVLVQLVLEVKETKERMRRIEKQNEEILTVLEELRSWSLGSVGDESS